MPTSTVRQPRFWLSVGGGKLNVIKARVTLVRGASPGEFEVELALDAPDSLGAMFWSQQTPIEASVIGTDGVNTKTLISGGIYKVDVEFTERIVRVEGRDATQDMIDSRSSENHRNQTNEQVAASIAAKHGLEFHSDGGEDMAGTTTDKKEFDYNSEEESDWDVVQECAEADGKIAFVVGNTLYYVNPGNTTGSTYSVTYTPPTAENYETSSVIRLACRRDVQISLGVQAEGASWYQPDKSANTSASDKS